ncbi:isoleucyl-tRNA synthetase [Friedmanniella endophytica]|uniref:Isoleucine--tRNA ligase n=1 Tax=Microlunatus kandeliicorticis TaxID=1759536 RepID=A0A7W3P630_9ACTN|nr:isoleucine--tRNA ligase [Microlunatus kandeliicorticis]MBA8794641.1 isoleucyl-tRNA synthetase [Microlunatus kandeliicorticis]
MVYPKASSGRTPGEEAFRVPSGPRFPEIEERVLGYWRADGTFAASVDRNPTGENGANEFVFYDGPPFANGLPHYGHLLTGYVKDIVPRFQTMRGRHVERRFGWDCHGLPAELEAMSQLGLKTKEDILGLGIEKFNEACRSSVLKYTEEWQDYVTRQARWVDFDHDYKTLDITFMESVLWAFKSLYDKGLVYEGWRVLPYCWNDETPLSSHELRMDEDVYQIRNDPAVTVGLRLETGELALIWTTTPWTLPSNLAIVVGEDIDYVVVQGTGDYADERFVIAEARLGAYARELGEDAADRVVERLKGSDLLGRSYTPPFSYYLGHENAFRIVPGDFVTTEDGTGLVHTAGAFGEDDKEVTDREGIEAVMPVGPDGKFTAPVDDYAGLLVFDANLPIIDDLKASTRALSQDHGALSPSKGSSVTRGTVLLRHESYAHSYPHCWRCRNPLIYKGVSSWFVQVTAIKDRMGELNQQITWVPEHVKDGQFGKWLANARDWSISRNRFWGSPIPIWRSDDPAYPRIDVYGSIAELEADFGVEVTDLHRPFIDELTRPNPDDPTGRSTMRRVEDVLDVWFDSGSMPYAQVHYPFENTDWFEHHYPGDFIVEYIGQTRGWFYTMHVLATALFDRPAFSSCISHGIVLGSDGQKMSKSLRNYPDVREVFDRDGADAMRWFLMSSPILRGGNLIVTEQGIREGVRQVIIPLWNTWYFFALYAGVARGGQGYDAKRSVDSTDVLDRYVLAKLRQLVVEVESALDQLDVAAACDAVRGFLDVLSNWYVRRSRDRFWDGESETSVAAFDTLWTVLETTCRVAAPLLPLITEEVWRGLTGERSVHLTDWPDATALPDDPGLVAAMDRVRDVCSAGSALRKANGLRVRLPLTSLTVVTEDAAALAPFTALIADELNVRGVELVELSEAGAAMGVSQTLQVNARAAGPRLGKDVQTAIRAAKSGDWSVGDDGTVVSGGIALQEGEYTLQTVITGAGEGEDHRAVGTLPGSGFVVLDTEVTPELAAEGVARDVVRAVQQARRDAGLEVSDRIRLVLGGEDEVRAAVERHAELIREETLTLELEVADPSGDTRVDLGGGRAVWVVALERR